MKLLIHLKLMSTCMMLALPWLFSSCATQSSAPPATSYTPWNGPVKTAGGSASDSATAGLRIGDAAVSRNDIDAILNNPNRKQQPGRPGLGTGWGSKISSNVDYTSFQRSSSKPKGLSSIYYNDKEGITAMTANSWHYTGNGMQKAADGLVEWGVKGSWGSLKNYHSNKRRYVVGRKGRTYALVVKNLCHSRLEVVLSVDGLDVMDGTTASFRKRGYVIQPGKTLTIKGFRTSESAVAAFKFSSVSKSYSKQLHGKTRNVGVIGMAVFTEKGADPWKWSRAAVKQRHGASPFAQTPNGRAR